jgi:hypothetical protein
MYGEFSATQLYTQLQVSRALVCCVHLPTGPLQYLQHVLDIPKMKARAEDSNEFKNNMHLLGKPVERFYSHLKERVETRYIKNNAYATVSLTKLFEGLFPQAKAKEGAQTPAQA